MERIFIQDTIHGTIEISPLISDLLASPEMQRLAHIKQLGLAYLTFPSANHTRFEHSLGTHYVASTIAREVGLSSEEKDLLAATGLLHDVGHLPFSHTLEYAFYSILKKTHMDITKRIIEGTYDITPDCGERERIPEILERNGLSPATVARLVLAPLRSEWTLSPWMDDEKEEEIPNPYLSQIIHSEADADQIDYLLRDAYFTGVSHGTIDRERLFKTFRIHNGEFVIDKKGVYAMEGMLIARSLMYSSVYFHHAVRIAETMLSRGVESILSFEMQALGNMTDAELFCFLQKAGGYPAEMACALKYRRLFKRAYVKKLSELTEEEKKALLEITSYDRKRKVEEEICLKANLKRGYALVDIPAPELLLSEPRIHKTGINVYDEKINSLSYYTPIARALQRRNIPDWAVMVCCREESKEDVAHIAEKILFR
jgi:HD superfamily phosphohydrolase